MDYIDISVLIALLVGEQTASHVERQMAKRPARPWFIRNWTCTEFSSAEIVTLDRHVAGAAAA